ncbi:MULTISPECIES: nitrogen fixation protein NifS [Pantoea]|uniref:nitrogen fixation protein NifS n=1 Tax=Pantoea TaxID=53335 RepID=UPI001CBB0E61|nr:nitrogen fixation protein NifS [Pantoea sp. OVA07A]
MSIKKIYMVSSPSPTLGRSQLHGAGGGLFGHYKEDDYIKEVQKKLDLINDGWIIVNDDTEANIEKIIENNALLIVCAPGLRFQFHSSGFNKNRIIHLNTFDYASKNVTPVIKKVKEISHEK